jgi:hypothetical protein
MRNLRRVTSLVLALFMAGAFSPAHAAEARRLPVPRAARQAVDVQLVIATDVSPSIDEMEAHLQREGIAEAFANPQVIQAIQAGSLGKIAVVMLDFSSTEYNRVVLDWRPIGDKNSALAFSEAVRRAPRTFGRHTSISQAIESAMLLLEASNFEGTKKVIDISGDGPNNWGRPVNMVRDEAVAKKITINGLPILGDPSEFGYVPDLDKYYSNCVIGGPAAFIVVARGFPDFARAIRNKLIAEIASDAPNPLLLKVAVAKSLEPPPRFQPAPRPALPKPNEAGCGNQFGGFGPFNGFDFPPRR